MRHRVPKIQRRPKYIGGASVGSRKKPARLLDTHPGAGTGPIYTGKEFMPEKNYD